MKSPAPHKPTMPYRGILVPPPMNRQPDPSFRLLGMIPAGTARDQPEDLRNEPARIEDLVPGIRPDDYFLVVDGDSMIDAGLLDGQYVIIRPDIPPRNGDICAVWVEGLGSTLKRIYFDQDVIRLVPANTKYQPMYIPADRVRVQGVLVAALAVRNFRPAR